MRAVARRRERRGWVLCSSYTYTRHWKSFQLLPAFIGAVKKKVELGLRSRSRRNSCSMRVQLKPNARPRRAASRRWSAPATAFLAATTRNLEKIGALVKNPLATIASPAHAVSKPGSENYRLTVDCRAVNACCVSIASSVPNIETMLAALSNGDSSCRFMAKLDFPQAFWQIALAKKSQEL
jgi:hypothetical protein